MLTTLLDLAGIGLIIGFAFSLWPPAALGVAGVCALVLSRQMVNGKRRP